MVIQNDTVGPLSVCVPLRYRTYVFDSETNLYYLQSRYYDPEAGRFINADAFASTGQGLLSNNMFAYCNNNPVMGYDPTGLVNWGGVAAGIGFALLAALAITAAGTAIGVAFAESAITTTVGAVDEAPVV